MSIPVIFFHKGNQEYLKVALQQCRKYNTKVILLGDESNKKTAEECNCSWADGCIFDNYEKWTTFERCYVPMSTNDYWFELNCFRRFFTIYEYILDNNIDKFVYLDSDIMTYTDFSLHLEIQQNDAGMCVPKRQDQFRWVANCGISFWNQKSLGSFLQYCIEVYSEKIDLLEEKWNYHKEKNIDGGICDMTLEYLWFVNDTSCKKLNMAERSEKLDGVMDFNLISSLNYLDDEYVMNKIIGTKKIIFKESTPYLKTTTGELVKVLAVHFLGPAKQYMKSYAKRNKLMLSDYVIFYLKKIKSMVKNIVEGKSK